MSLQYKSYSTFNQVLVVLWGFREFVAEFEYEYALINVSGYMKNDFPSAVLILAGISNPHRQFKSLMWQCWSELHQNLINATYTDS